MSNEQRLKFKAYVNNSLHVFADVIFSKKGTVNCEAGRPLHLTKTLGKFWRDKRFSHGMKRLDPLSCSSVKSINVLYLLLAVLLLASLLTSDSVEEVNILAVCGC